MVCRFFSAQIEIFNRNERYENMCPVVGTKLFYLN